MAEEIVAIITLVGLMVVCSAVFGLTVQNASKATLLAVITSTSMWTAIGIIVYEVHLQDSMWILGVIAGFFVSLIGCIILVNMFDGLKNSMSKHVPDEHKFSDSSISHG